MKKTSVKFLEQIVPKEDIFYEEPMSKHTTFRVGGNAEVLVQISHKNQLEQLIPYFIQNKTPYYIVGNGSNLLVSDEGFDGIICKITSKMSHIQVEGEYITAQTGALLSKVAKTALEHGLTGFEFASGIPGTLGGALVMNAGAYDGEIKNVVAKVTAIDETGQMKTLSAQELQFGYRNSVFKHTHMIAIEAMLLLQSGSPSQIQNKMEEFAKKRKEKQPLEYPSAGSTFQRPEGHFAGKLIMDSGLTGFRIGGARVSTKHCGFVINDDNASAGDVFTLIGEVQRIVKEKTGVMLTPEVICLGRF